jgi:dipeptidyl aminopeptidase/acylaminoacyl peptidase
MTNAVLPGLLLDLAKEHADHKAERFDVKVMVVTPDGKERKALCTAQWTCRRDDLARLMVMSPTWSRDSRHVFYTHPLGEAFSIVDLDILSGRTQALLLSSTGAAVPSPDGQWVATLLADDGSKQVALVLAKANGRMQKYVRLDLDLEEKDDLGLATELSWSPDSTSVLVSVGQPMLVVNAGTGEGRAYRDPETGDIAFGVFSPSGDSVYYLSGLKNGDPNSGDQDVDLRCLTLKNGQTKRLVRFSEGMDLKSIGRFSVSPNGKAFLFRCTRQDPAGMERSILILWDGKKTRSIETDPWLEGL